MSEWIQRIHHGGVSPWLALPRAGCGCTLPSWVCVAASPPCPLRPSLCSEPTNPIAPEKIISPLKHHLKVSEPAADMAAEEQGCAIRAKGTDRGTGPEATTR